MKTTSGFSLRKWYLDCVTEDGSTFIGYSAHLEWNAVNLHYSSTISTEGSSSPQTRMSLKRNASPQVEDERIVWSSKALGLSGSWIPNSEPVKRVLLDNEEGKVTWSCLQPSSHVKLSIRPDKELAGVGYAEFLELTVKPWQLPISELRWGRFHSDTDAVTWIDWKGSHPLQLVFLNGEEVTHSSVTDEQILMNGSYVLDLNERTELRNGALVSTVLSAIPGLDLLVPPRLLHAQECKWRTRGQLSMNGASKRPGWAIHEVVKFGSE